MLRLMHGHITHCLAPSPACQPIPCQLVHVAPDGSVKAVSAEDAAAAVAAAGARCTDPLVTVPVNVMKSVEAALAKQKADYLEKLKAAGGPPAVGTQVPSVPPPLRFLNLMAAHPLCGTIVFWLHWMIKQWGLRFDSLRVDLLVIGLNLTHHLPSSYLFRYGTVQAQELQESLRG